MNRSTFLFCIFMLVLVVVLFFCMYQPQTIHTIVCNKIEVHLHQQNNDASTNYSIGTVGGDGNVIGTNNNVQNELGNV